MLRPFTLAHISDIHLGPLPRLRASEWGVKRLSGFVNWHRNRKGLHLRPVLDRLVADMLAQEPDHIAVTGDLVNIGLPSEHAAALDWLGTLGPPNRVTVVPGNHDIYVPLRSDPGALRWQPYMTSDVRGASVAEPTQDGFPFVRRFGSVALIGLNSAVPTPPFIASGRCGPRQLGRLAKILDSLGSERATRIVLIHHPPLPGQAARTRGLADAGALEAVLIAHGAELVLHGHNHLSMRALRRWSAGEIPVVGVPSASQGRPYKGEPPARYNLYRLSPEEPSACIEMVGRGLAQPDGPIVELDRVWLKAPGPAVAVRHA